MPEPAPEPRLIALGARTELSTDRDGGRAERAGAEVRRLVARFTASDPGPADPDGWYGWDTGAVAPVGRLAGALASSAKAAGTVAVAGGRWLADTVVDVAPYLQIRDHTTLHAAYSGRTGDHLADSLVRTASRTTAAVGAAGGAIAAAEFAAPPTLLGVPLQLAAETLLTVAIELRLVGELHEIYGLPAEGPAHQRGAVLLTSWARRRGVDPFVAGAAGVLGLATRNELRKRILRRFGRSATSLAPFLAGAVAGAEVNRRETVALAQRIRTDLRGRPSYR